MVKIGKHRPKWSKMAKKFQKWSNNSKYGQNGQKW